MSSVASHRSFAYLSANSSRHGAVLLEVGAVAAALVLAAFVIEFSDDMTASAWIMTIAMAALVVWIVVQDLKTFTIADGAVVSIACLALAGRWSAGDAGFTIALDCLLTGGVLLAFREFYYRSRGFDGLGLGDVKLAAAAGLLVGAAAFAWALLAASLLALGFVVMRQFVLTTNRAGYPFNGADRLAFGAVLAPAIWCVWVIQQAPLLLPLAGP